ncbi:hypothetical protein GGR57DRAFT_161692 [Xylariaceae sp. FL1272]|nr:hypothetical protein GGR57DRAFT_161692 [Xylariaceae sp. FL1272]
MSLEKMCAKMLLNAIVLLQLSAATASHLARVPFLNATSTTNTAPGMPTVAIACFPYEDPHCCVSKSVCQCRNGTFFATNKGYGASLCDPPSPYKYGDDAGSIPGFCCGKDKIMHLS